MKKRDDTAMQLENHLNADSNYYVEAKKVLDVTERNYEIFESSEDEEKQQFLTFMLQSSVLNGKKLDFTLRKPFDAILNANESKTWL